MLYGANDISDLMTSYYGLYQRIDTKDIPQGHTEISKDK